MRVAHAATRMRDDLLLVTLDLALISLGFLFAALVRYEGGEAAGFYWTNTWQALPVAIVVFIGSNALWRLYGPVWRLASINEARRVVGAGATATVIVVAANEFDARAVPLSVALFGSMLATALVGALRFHSRLFAFERRSRDELTPVVILGAGEAGAALVRAMRERADLEARPVAFLDDDPRKLGRSVLGVPVVGTLSDLPEIVRDSDAVQAWLAVASADRALVRRAVDVAERADVPLKVVPSLRELIDGRVTVSDVRDVRIEDLLGRQQVETDFAAVRELLADRSVLITGGGGSIGAEIARQVAGCGPASLVLLDHDETHLHDALGTISTKAEAVLADVCDVAALHRAFARYQPDVVFHAAAHKHVPVLEAHPCEAVHTNLLGTRNVVDASVGFEVEHLVFISTDKAVRPTSVMGASKNVGEQIVLSGRPESKPWCAVRFGNVLGSRGSVIPTFAKQIRAGGPVTVTHPSMTRFFMTIPEAVQLVLQAAVYADGGEIFMLDMGEPVRIVELAERMIRLSGHALGSDIAIEYTGVRAGEKLAEELSAPDEASFPTAHESIVRLQPTLLPCEVLKTGLEFCCAAAAQFDDVTATELLMCLAHRSSNGEDMSGKALELAAIERRVS